MPSSQTQLHLVGSRQALCHIHATVFAQNNDVRQCCTDQTYLMLHCSLRLIEDIPLEIYLICSEAHSCLPDTTDDLCLSF